MCLVAGAVERRVEEFNIRYFVDISGAQDRGGVVQKVSQEQIEVNALGTDILWHKGVGVKCQMFPNSIILFCLSSTNTESILTS